MDDSRPGETTVFEAMKAAHLRETLHRYGDALRERRKGIDRLNVYPVPDGDTGTNLSLTVQSVVKELKAAAADDMHSVASAISKGAIMGARGNSGAILAQALRGLAESVKDKATIGPADIAEALEKARVAAYQSVLKPVEGTMLTVLTASAEAARKSVDAGHQLKEQVEHIRHASAEALARTPDLLPVLKNAGVVDAGGSGFLLFIDALRYVVTGEPIPGKVDEDSDFADSPDVHEAHTEISDLRYEVMYLLEADDDKIQGFKEAWSTLGDSIVVVGGDGMWNCHIHTDEVEPTIDAGKAVGRPYEIRITDLQEQASEAHGSAWTENLHDGWSDEPVETGVIAVVSGDGLGALYRDAGVSRIVSGGQSMNPSVAEIMEKIDAAPSENVVVLPNNKNICATAEQAAKMSAKNAAVIPTISIMQGMSAMLAYDSSQPLDANISAMTEAVESVIAGEVTQAVRDVESEEQPVRKGDWLGLQCGDGIKAVAPSLSDALVQLIDVLVRDDHEIVTVVEGEGSTKEATDALRLHLSQSRPGVELEVHFGGQALYPYYIGVE